MPFLIRMQDRGIQFKQTESPLGITLDIHTGILHFHKSTSAKIICNISMVMLLIEYQYHPALRISNRKQTCKRVILCDVVIFGITEEKLRVKPFSYESHLVDKTYPITSLVCELIQPLHISLY